MANEGSVAPPSLTFVPGSGVEGSFASQVDSTRDLEATSLDEGTSNS